MAKHLPHPSLHAAVICDRAIQEAGTRKWTLVGTWTEIYAQKVPCNHPEMAIYFCISDAEGEYDLDVELVSLQGEGETIGRLTGKLKALDRLGMSDFAMTFRGLPFPQFGRYVFRLLMNKKVVGEKPFWVKSFPNQNKSS